VVHLFSFKTIIQLLVQLAQPVLQDLRELLDQQEAQDPMALVVRVVYPVRT
jgi:hypothetical protein